MERYLTKFGVWLVDIEWVKNEISKKYHNDDIDLKRELIISTSLSNYGDIGAYFLALNGSPPKGYAVYIPDCNKIIIIDAWGEKVKICKDTRIIEL